MYNLLYAARIRRGLTQEMLAKNAGVSRRTICRLEKSGGYPNQRVATALCRALGCRFEEVFALDVPLH